MAERVAEVAKCESDTVSMALAGTPVEDPDFSTLWTKVDLQKSLASLTAVMAHLQTKDTLSDLGTAPSSRLAPGGGSTHQGTGHLRKSARRPLSHYEQGSGSEHWWCAWPQRNTTSLWKSCLNFGKVMSSPPKLLRKHWAGSAGQLPCAHYPDHSSCSLPLCSNTFSPSHTTNPHHTQEYQPGGVRVNASATKSVAQVTHGLVGWISDIEAPDKSTVWWFQLEIKPEECPWAFLNGDSTRRISALEMLGTLILATFLILRSGSAMLRLKLSLISDNQGNIFALLNQNTKKMPTAAFVMQLVNLLYTKGAQLAPNHCRRDHNQWADDLTHPNPIGFTPEKRLSLSPVLCSFSTFASGST